MVIGSVMAIPPVRVDKNGMAKKKVQDQGEQILRSEAYDTAAMTKDEAQRRYWTFYEASNLICFES